MFEEAPNELLIHHHDARPVRCVGVGKAAALQQRDAHGLKESGADIVVVGLHTRAGRVARLDSVQGKAFGGCPTQARPAADQRCGLHAGNRLDAVEQTAIEEDCLRIAGNILRSNVEDQ